MADTDLPTSAATADDDVSAALLVARRAGPGGDSTGEAEAVRAAAAGAGPQQAAELEAAAELIDELVGLVHHIDIHASYQTGGYRHMTSTQKALYRRVTSWGEHEPPH